MNKIYLYKLQGGDDWKVFEVRVVEGTGGVIGVLGRDDGNGLRGIARPVGRRERESGVSAGVHQGQLHKTKFHSCSKTFIYVETRVLFSFFIACNIPTWRYFLSSHSPSRLQRLMELTPMNQSGDGTIRTTSETWEHDFFIVWLLGQFFC